MAENSSIAWTNHTVNFVIGCTKVDELCTNCYADTMDERRFSKTLGGGTKENPVRHWGPNSPRHVRFMKAESEIRLLNHKAKKAGRIDKVFINSLSDTFEDHKDLIEARATLFVAVEHAKDLIFQLLTKRPENVTRMVPKDWLASWPPNAWIGTSVGHQKSADTRIPELLKIPAKVRFLSCEPLLGPVNIRRFFAHSIRCEKLPGPGMNGGQPCECVFPSWVIVGGESGDNRRELNLDWAYSLRDQCRDSKTAFFMKQDSARLPGQRGRIPDDLWVQEFPV